MHSLETILLPLNILIKQLNPLVVKQEEEDCKYLSIFNIFKFYENEFSNLINGLLQLKINKRYILLENLFKHINIVEDIPEKLIFFREFSFGKNGRIDILISKDNQWAIGIENKWDSKMGPNQVERYIDYMESNYEKYWLIYLTKEAEDIKREYKNLITITYKYDIFAILKELNDRNLPKNACVIINQFLIYLDQYFNLGEFKNMNSEIELDTIKQLAFNSTLNFKSVLSIIDNGDKLKEQVFKNLIDKLLYIVKRESKIPISITYDDDLFSKYWTGVNIKLGFIDFRIESERPPFKELIIGIPRIDEERYNRKKIFMELVENYSGKPSETWFYYNSFDQPLRSFSDSTSLIQIVENTDYYSNIIKQRLFNMYSICQEHIVSNTAI